MGVVGADDSVGPLGNCEFAGNLRKTSAFRRADELATAMECRCYHGGEGRTALRVLRYQTADWLSLTAFVALTAGVIVLKKFGF